MMHRFCGDAIFERMVLVATNQKRRQMYGFTAEDEAETRKVFKHAFKLAIGSSCPVVDDGPPIVYISLTDKSSEVFDKFRNAQVTDPTGLYCKFVDNVCARCAVTIRSTSGGEEVGITTEGHKTLQDCDNSKCHPIFLPRYSTFKRIIGGIAHISTFYVPYICGYLVHGVAPWPSFYSSDEICPKCKLPPGAPGCTPIKEMCTIEWQGKRETILEVNHTSKLDTITVEES